jgi:hypothetical protein
MPFPDSTFPSVIRGLTPTQSLRLMCAAPRLLEMLKSCVDLYGALTVMDDLSDAETALHDRVMLNAIAAIREAEGDER